MGNFHSDLRTGEIGEVIVLDYLNANENTLTVVDVRQEKKFQNMDIDFLHLMDDGTYNKIEVKTDRMGDKTGNIVYETVSNRRLNTIGCFEKTQCDYMFYYLTNSRQLYIIHMPSLKEYVYREKGSMQLKRMGDNAEGYLLKIKDLIALNIMKLLETNLSLG